MSAPVTFTATEARVLRHILESGSKHALGEIDPEAFGTAPKYPFPYGMSESAWFTAVDKAWSLLATIEIKGGQVR